MNLDLIISTLYLAIAASLAVFGLHRMWLLWRFRAPGRVATNVEQQRELPSVTVQLPLFNERTVAARAIQAVGRIDWPRDRFEVQVLDDSTDETRDIVEREVTRLRHAGVSAYVLRRASRSGFKAGALRAGMQTATGQLMCIFDADFVPEPDFLRCLVGAFDDERIGMVQARWEHLNRDESWLTRAQATLLDGHFVITHKVRFDRGLFFHFNGTAGIWRRAAIESAGGWQLDTLTEDLDLSYRAQLAGWRFVYASHVTAPAELPPNVAAFQTQQARWARGTVQVGRKLVLRILRAQLRPRVKLEALLHLASHAGHPLVLAMVLVMPIALMRPSSIPQSWFFVLLALCTPAVVLFYETSQRAIGRPVRKRLIDALLAVVLGVGMSVQLTLAALRGWQRDIGVFERTPKRGTASRTRGYRAAALFSPGIELVFAAWASYGALAAARVGAWSAVVFQLLYIAGFTWVGVLSLSLARAERPATLREVAREKASAQTQSIS